MDKKNLVDKKEKIAVILFNLGGPDSLKAVKPFLFNLFYDPAIIALNNPWRWLVAKVLSRKRAPIAREIYKKIGNKSPILDQTKAQAVALENNLNAESDRDYCCFVSMRYWHPFSCNVAKKVKNFAPNRMVLLPLYPHYSITTTGSSLIDWAKNAKTAGLDTSYRVVRDYPEDAGFIEAHVRMIQAEIKKIGSLDEYRILYSAHGLPEKVIEAGDPYRQHTENTCRLIQEQLGHPDHIVCFQSRVGPLKWIEPYTDDEIRRVGEEGKSLIIVPVSFVSEHSETLVELDMEYRDIAEKSGVKNYIRIAAIGCHPAYISTLAKLTKDILK